MTGAHEGQHWKWNHCPWMPPLLYDRGSWRSTLEVKSLSLNASPTIWQSSWRSTLEVKSLSLNASPTIWQRLMKVNTRSEITVLECLSYLKTEAQEGLNLKWNIYPWMPPLLYDRGSWRSTLEVKSLSLNASPTIWQELMKVNTGSEITLLECLSYYMTEAHESQHWKWNIYPWMPPLLYESGSWRSTLEVKYLSLNAPPTIWQWLMKVTIGSDITVLECLPYNMTVVHEGQLWKWNHCPWMCPLIYDRDSWRSTLEVK